MGDDRKWEVTYFKVETTTGDGKTDSLYANGRMQVPVIVTIKAIEKGTTKRCWLQPDELSEIALIDYDDSPNKLSDGWSYTDSQSNGSVFATAMNVAINANALARQVSDSTATARDAAVWTEDLMNQDTDSLVITSNAAVPAGEVAARSDNDPQSKKFWVLTTRIESKRIGARIKQPDDKTVTTHSKFDSRATLKGIEPIVYTTDNVTIVRKDTADGSYRFDWQSAGDGNWYTSQKHWDQDNYFVSSTIHEFIKADIYGFDTTGYASGHPGDSRLKNCYAYCAPDDKNLKLSFIWEFGPEATKAAGLYKEGTIVDWLTPCGRKAYAYPDIKVNQKSNALCLTRLAIDCPDTIWGAKWSSGNCGFTIYDVYGNAGKFSASYSDDHNLLTISNAN
ncbi:hypothetical protein B0T25DRAFT_537470 [Lasiosphaeria hispida]|uniref:Uncharacterized protein n=1 Tax=Lasiosphaeria hispida TaxID=260671 RepID=A0AAJ0MFU9_9PEZI|nr:hypothetical protein B0T25DRAFT_537470 [Lasiosphaeria hispida]